MKNVLKRNNNKTKPFLTFRQSREISFEWYIRLYLYNLSTDQECNDIKCYEHERSKFQGPMENRGSHLFNLPSFPQ